MRRHLQYTSEDYTQEADARGVRPMSNIDCQIIDQLISTIKANNDLKTLGLILEQWKHDDDESILQNVLDYRDGNPVNLTSESDDLNVEGIIDTVFITIKNSTFKVHYIQSISNQDYYDHDNGRMIYYLVINKGPLPAKYAWYEDTKIVCYSVEEREELKEEIKQKLLDYQCKFI